VSLFEELKRRNVFRVAFAYAVVAWLLLQVGDTLAPALLLPDWTNRLLALLLILGFPLALFFAWAFELTPEGIRPEKSVKPEASIAPVTGRKLDRLIIVLLVVAVGYFAWDKFSHREVVTVEPPATAATADRRSIAVLPFVNMSADAEQAYFSDGLSEELLNLLAKIPQLRVTSRTSAFSFKGKDYTIGDVAGQLGVRYVLEGSVRRSAEQIRVTAQLIDAASDTHLWSETWDRDFRDVFAIQDEIAAAVTTALKIQLVDELPHAYVTDPRAYDLYLQARELVDQHTEASTLAAESLLLELLAIDPDYAPALVLLGETSIFLGGWHSRPMEESFERAKTYAEQAIEAAPSFSDAYLLLSQLAKDHDRDLARAKRLIDKAIEHDPASFRARLHASWLSALAGESGLSIELAEEQVQLDPLSGQAYWTLGYAHLFAGQFDESAEAFRQVRKLTPDRVGLHTALGRSLFLAGEYEQALAEFDAEPYPGFTHYGRAMIYFKMGEQAKSDAALDALLSLDDAESWAAQIASVHAVRGEKDEAFEWLYKALELNDQGISNMQLFPFLENLHDDPRFAEFVEQLWSGRG
jgi:TolB-like protein/Tfp pilus assembly protein PilF